RLPELNRRHVTEAERDAALRERVDAEGGERALPAPREDGRRIDAVGGIRLAAQRGDGEVAQDAPMEHDRRRHYSSSSTWAPHGSTETTVPGSPALRARISTGCGPGGGRNAANNAHGTGNAAPVAVNGDTADPAETPSSMMASSRTAALAGVPSYSNWSAPVRKQRPPAADVNGNVRTVASVVDNAARAMTVAVPRATVRVMPSLAIVTARSARAAAATVPSARLKGALAAA